MGTPESLINSNDMPRYEHDISWEVRLEMVDHQSNKFYAAGCNDHGHYYISYGKNGTKGQSRPKGSYQEIRSLIATKLKKGYKNTVLNASYPPGQNPPQAPDPSMFKQVPDTQGFFQQPPIGPCSVWLSYINPAKRIQTIKAIRQLMNEIRGPSGLREVKAIIEDAQPSLSRRGLLIRYAGSVNDDWFYDFRDASSALGFRIEYKHAPEERVWPFEQYKLFKDVHYVRFENGRWRGYDKANRKLMLIPESYVREIERDCDWWGFDGNISPR